MAADIGGTAGATRIGTGYVNIIGNFNPLRKSLVAEQSAMRTRFAAIGKAGALAVAGIGVAAVKMSIDYRHQMRLISTQAGASNKEVKNLRGEVLKLSGKTIFAPEALARALFHIESVGYRGAKAMHTLNAAQQLATVGDSDLEQTTYALVSAQKTGITGTKNLHHAIGELNAIVGTGDLRMQDLVGALGTGLLPAAENAGVSLRDIGSALDVMTARGQPARLSATRLRMTLSLLGSPTKQATDALKSIGIGQLQLAEKMQGPHGLVDALNLLHDHLQRVGDNAHQAQILTEAFGGGRSSAAIRTLVDNTGDLQYRFDRIGKLTGHFNDELKQAEADPMNRLRNAWVQIEASLISIAQNATPAVAKAFQDVSAVITDPHTGWAEKFSQLADMLSHAIAVAGPDLAKIAIGLGAEIAKGVVDGFIHADVIGKIALSAALISIFGGMDAWRAIGRGMSTAVFGEATAAAGTEGAAAGSAFGKAATEAAAVTGGGTKAPVVAGGGAKLPAGAGLYNYNVSKGVAEGEKIGANTATGITKGIQTKMSSARASLSKSFKGIGSRLGVAMIGALASQIGGQAVGGELGSALQDVGTGAAAGFAVAGPWGAAGGAAIGAVIDGLQRGAKQNKDAFISAGGAAARLVKEGIGKQLVSGKGVNGKDKTIGELMNQQTRDAISSMLANGADAFNNVKEAWSKVWFEGGMKGLKDLQPIIDKTLKDAKLSGADPEQIAALKQLQQQLASSAVGVRNFRQNIGLMNRNVGSSVGEITKLMKQNRNIISDTWGIDSDKGRKELARNFEAAIGNIRKAMDRGDIKVKDGMALIQKYMHNAKIVDITDEQAKKMGDAWGAGFAKVGDITKKGAAGVLDDLKKMGKQQRDIAATQMLERLKIARREGDISAATYRDMKGKILTTFKDIGSVAGTETGKMATNVAKTYRQLANAVSGMGGLQNIQKNVNAALKSLGVSHNINWQVVKASVAESEHWIGQQRGGPLTGGLPTGDTIPVMAERDEYFVNQKASRKHRALLDYINFHDVPRFRSGGLVNPVPGAGVSRTDQGKDFFGTGPIKAMGDAVIQYAGPMSGGWEPSGVVYKMLSGAPKSIHPSSDTIFNYEHLNPIVRQGQKVRAGQTIAQMTGGIEIGFAQPGTGTPLTPYNGLADGTAMPAGIAMAHLLALLGAGKFVAGGGPMFKKLKRIMLKGPKGPLHDIGQAGLDKTTKAANAYLSKLAVKREGSIAGTTQIGKGGFKIGDTISGPVSWFNSGLGAFGFGPGPGIALDPWPDSGWNDPRITSMAGSIWNTKIGGHSANLMYRDKGPAIAGRKIDVTAEGVRKLGLSTSSFPTQSIGSATLVKLMRGGLVGSAGLPIPSYHDGGIVAGRPGSDQLIVAQAGEEVTERGARRSREGMILNWEDGTYYIQENADRVNNSYRRHDRRQARARR